jgi:AAA+ superfamily predicted ATPase
MDSAGVLNSHPARGLFLDPAHVRALLNPPGASPATSFPAEADDSPLGQLRATFSLSPAESDVLLLAVAPEFDPRYESIYAYLHNDVTRKAASIELALRLWFEGDGASAEARRIFHPGSPLARECLITVAGERFASRAIASDSRVAGFLAGDDAIDERLHSWTRCFAPGETAAPLPFAEEQVDLWCRAFDAASASGGIMLFRGRHASGKRAVAHALSQTAGVPLLSARPAALDEVGLRLLRREARLRDAAVYIAMPPEASLEPVDAAFRDSGVPVLCGRPGRHDDERFAHYCFDIPGLPAEARRNVWQSALPESSDCTAGIEEVAAKFSLTSGQIAAAAGDAARHAMLREESVTAEDLHRAARRQAGARLLRLATPVELVFRWDDLVLPAPVFTQLREICSQVRQREHVLHAWNFAARLGAARGIAVLFAGPSGTGKTMAAGVIARELGLDLYRIDLATVVSKYIGETEKNLSRIFEDAEDSNAILFFDEADALFGKRSEVKDAHDRYANLEIAYLLQRMETYSGVAILATNLMSNIDEAFARRMAHLVEFPFPDVPLRQRLWRQCLPAEAPLSGDVNLAALANQFHVTGGNIRNITLAAAFVASEQGCAIGMDHLVRATARELAKIGRQPSRAEFDQFYSLVQHPQ